MNRYRWLAGVSLLFIFCASADAQVANPPCQPPPLPAGPRENYIFTEAQENDLGDAVAEHIQRQFLVIDDEDLTGYIRTIGARLLRHIPPTQILFQFYLFDQPVANAFTLPGGRVYISRKLVALARTEDEIAGVMSHEIGHGLMRDGAERANRLFTKLLGVRSVGDRRDIFEKYHQVIENVMRKPEAGRVERDDHNRAQMVADQIAMYAVVAAGYSPQAYADFWDRLAETKGKKGGWLSDLFGTTKPESRRLREMVKIVSALPPECTGTRVASSAEEFAKWKTNVVAYTGLGRKERLHSLVSRKVLDPPLQDDIGHLKFSPDGRYALAQDDASIHVLSREPFAHLFRIDAQEAEPAQFTPDSREVVYHTTGLRIERWSIEEEQRTAVHEIVFQRRCMQSELSPDGMSLACLSSKFELILLDVAAGTPFFEKKDFLPGISFLLLLLQIIVAAEDSDSGINLRLVEMHFSPDAKYFAASSDLATVALDLKARAPISLPGSIKKVLGRRFAFLGPDRIVGLNPDKPEESAVLHFPSGQLVRKLKLGRQELKAATRGEYVLLLPIDKYAVGVMDLNTGKIFMANKKAAFDAFDQLYLSEQRTGEIGLYAVGSPEPMARVQLERSLLGRIRAVALTPDHSWLAVSQRNRGAVWNLTRGERVFHVRGFRGAHFTGQSALYADFPKQDEVNRNVARLDLTSNTISIGISLEDLKVTQYGRYLVELKPAKKGGETHKNVILEVRDATNAGVLWTRPYPKAAPWTRVNPETQTMVLYWTLDEDHARDEVKRDPALKARVAAMKEKEGDYLLHLVDVRNGNLLGKLLVETGKRSFRISNVYASGDWVVITDTQNRVLIYSLSSGEQKGRMFGSKSAVSVPAGLLCVENERGQLSLYDLATLAKRSELNFASPVSWAEFSGDGRRLFVLTANQTAYVFDLSSGAMASKPGGGD